MHPPGHSIITSIWASRTAADPVEKLACLGPGCLQISFPSWQNCKTLSASVQNLQTASGVSPRFSPKGLLVPLPPRLRSALITALDRQTNKQTNKQCHYWPPLAPSPSRHAMQAPSVYLISSSPPPGAKLERAVRLPVLQRDRIRRAWPRRPAAKKGETRSVNKRMDQAPK